MLAVTGGHRLVCFSTPGQQYFIILKTSISITHMIKSPHSLPATQLPGSVGLFLQPQLKLPENVPGCIPANPAKTSNLELNWNSRS